MTAKTDNKNIHQALLSLCPPQNCYFSGSSSYMLFCWVTTLWMWRLPLCLAALNLPGVISAYDHILLGPAYLFLKMHNFAGIHVALCGVAEWEQ